jgi:hypothetical protein
MRHIVNINITMYVCVLVRILHHDIIRVHFVVCVDIVCMCITAYSQAKAKQKRRIPKTIFIMHISLYFLALTHHDDHLGIIKWMDGWDVVSSL